MRKPKVYVLYGEGIGCHNEVVHAYKRAGAEPELIHIKKLLEEGKDFLFESQILNMSGGFLHGDIPEAGMSAANELINSGIKENLLEYADKGNIIYGQCNGFQLLVKTGLLPGIDNDYSKQTVTLTQNDCGNYFVDFVLHKIEKKHFAFENIGSLGFYLWCRHGEGKIQFYYKHGLISKEKGEKNREKVNKRHVLLRYIDPNTKEPTQSFPFNPNGSIDAIAGLVNTNGHIFGHMGHPEVSIYESRDPRWFKIKDVLRRQGIKLEDLTVNEGIGYKIFKNIVDYVK